MRKPEEDSFLLKVLRNDGLTETQTQESCPSSETMSVVSQIVSQVSVIRLDVRHQNPLALVSLCFCVSMSPFLSVSLSLCLTVSLSLCLRVRVSLNQPVVGSLWMKLKLQKKESILFFNDVFACIGFSLTLPRSYTYTHTHTHTHTHTYAHTHMCCLCAYHCK